MTNLNAVIFGEESEPDDETTSTAVVELFDCRDSIKTLCGIPDGRYKCDAFCVSSECTSCLYLYLHNLHNIHCNLYLTISVCMLKDIESSL